MFRGANIYWSRAWWIVGISLFLLLELALRIKLGSIWTLAILWVLAWQWLALGLGDEVRRRDAGGRVAEALYFACAALAVIFTVFSVLNIGLRTLDPAIGWFQLP